MAVNTEGIDFATTDWTPAEVNSTNDLLQLLDRLTEKALKALAEIKEEDLLKTWTIKNGGQLLQAMTKFESIRHAYSQTYSPSRAVGCLSSPAGYSCSRKLWPKCR